MNKIVVAKKTDKKLVKKLAQNMRSTLISLADK